MKNITLAKVLPIALGLSILIPTQSIRAQIQPQTNSPRRITSQNSAETPYNQYMRLGYAALQRGDAETATLYFRNALYERPNDRAATIAYWNARDAITQTGSNNSNQDRSDYDRYMVAGYDATDSKDYQTALNNFKQALNERPGDYYATQALRNVQTYLTRGQGQPLATAPLPPDRVYPIESPYNRYMRLGYAAQQNGDYQTAANYFRSALTEVPRDRYATIAYWNAVDATSKGGNSNTTARESDYDRYMRVGYDATERGDYQVALINFQRALQERPNDYYATQAVRNVRAYIARGEQQQGVTRNQ